MTTSKTAMPAPPPGVTPLKQVKGYQKPCPKCLNEKSHAKHNPLADNCIFFGGRLRTSRQLQATFGARDNLG